MKEQIVCEKIITIDHAWNMFREIVVLYLFVYDRIQGQYRICIWISYGNTKALLISLPVNEILFKGYTMDFEILFINVLYVYDMIAKKERLSSNKVP